MQLVRGIGNEDRRRNKKFIQNSFKSIRRLPQKWDRGILWLETNNTYWENVKKRTFRYDESIFWMGVRGAKEWLK